MKIIFLEDRQKYALLLDNKDDARIIYEGVETGMLPYLDDCASYFEDTFADGAKLAKPYREDILKIEELQKELGELAGVV